MDHKYYKVVRIIFGAILTVYGLPFLAIGLIIAIFNLVWSSDAQHVVVAMFCLTFALPFPIGIGMLLRARWAWYGFIIADVMVNGALIMAALAARYQRLHPEFYPGLRGELYPEAVKVISPASSSMPISILIIAFIFLWGLWTLTRPMAKEEWGMS